MLEKLIKFITTEKKRDPDDKIKARESTTQAIIILVIASGAGMVGIIIFALQSTTIPKFFTTIGSGLLISCAALFLGGIIGFLFGIPRLTQPGWKPDEATAAGPSQSGGYQENTNLEQISDWLTKIIVGVALTQVILIQGYLQTFADSVTPALGGFPGSGMFGVALLVFFSIDGFLIGYLWTRLFMLESLTRKKQEIEKLQELEDETRKDTEALKLADAILNRRSGDPEVKEEELIPKIKESSSTAKRLIFYQAVMFMDDNRNDSMAKERVIPLFSGLIAADPSNRYHRNHGQLAIALKDKCEPEWEKALDHLDTAIKIRGPWQTGRLSIYEYNRALCRIHIDQNFGIGKPADEQIRKSICDDLKVASREYSDQINKENTIRAWLKVNGIDSSRFTPPDSPGTCSNPGL